MNYYNMTSLFSNGKVMIYQEKRGSECQAEDHGAGQVRLIHDAAICCLQGMKNRQSLLPDVIKVDSQF